MDMEFFFYIPIIYRVLSIIIVCKCRAPLTNISVREPPVGRVQ